MGTNHLGTNRPGNETSGYQTHLTVQVRLETADLVIVLIFSLN